MGFSIIVPVYNRPEEMEEFLASWTEQQGEHTFEILVIEDGSKVDCRAVVERYQDRLPLRYFYKANSGPGDSRNFGMQQATYDYFLIFDSDCVIPSDYLNQVALELQTQYVDFFGGPDAAATYFNPLQKAISFAMTSVLTTGGVRGSTADVSNFQPRSFNMGISRAAFKQSGGFGLIHPGEDPDLVLRLWKLGFKSRLFPQAKVFHKRRISFELFEKQVNKFGKTRPILDLWHPQYRKITYAFPALFTVGLGIGLLLAFAGFPIVLALYALYFIAVGMLAYAQYNDFQIALMAIRAVVIQFWGYGRGYIVAVYKLKFLKQQPQEAFPELFFKK